MRQSPAERRDGTAPDGEAVEEPAQTAVRVCAALLFVVALLTLFSRFFHAHLYGYFEDDFFYYAQVAKNLVTHHRSSFDGVHLTNGYHPLWMGLIAVLYAVFPRIAFFVAVQAVSLAAIVTLFVGLLRCLQSLAVPARLVPPVALLLSLHALLLFRFGMEVTLALPLGVSMLATVVDPAFAWTPRQTVRFGVLACLTILARLDGIFLVFALLVAQVIGRWREGWRGGERRGLSRWVLLAACFVPFAAYLLLNLHEFHSALPVSGVAKQLKPLLPPSPVTLRSLLLPFDRNKAAFVYPALLVIGLGALAFRRGAAMLSATQRTTLLALFAFPVLHLGSLSLLSDWTVWPWYFYSLVYPVLASAVVLLLPYRGRAATAGRWAKPVPVLALLIAFYTVYLAAYAFFKRPAKTAELAVFVARFSEQHPGVYAMGDDAGSTAFRSSSPFVQLEGLMMDAPYINVLRQRTPLREVLRRYGVDYYVALVIERSGPCFVTHEPAQAGPRSPRLPGRICAQPIAQDVADGVSVGIFRAADVLEP